MCITPDDFNDGYEAFTKYLDSADRSDNDSIDTYIHTRTNALCTPADDDRNMKLGYIHGFDKNFRSENDKYSA